MPKMPKSLNPFQKVALSYKEQPIKPFDARSKDSQEYIDLVKGNDIDQLFIGWLCERDSFFAYLYKFMKKEARVYSKLTVATQVAEAGWPILLPTINTWILKDRKPVLLVPVPSNFGVSEKFADVLYLMLRKARITDVGIAQLLQKSNNQIEIKRIKGWDARAKIASDIFQAEDTDISQYKVLLVDDIVTSGASIRSCAQLLKSCLASEISAVSLATNLRDSQ